MMNSQTSLMSPCFFGISLQQGTQLVAGINIVGSIFIMIVVTIYLFMYDSTLPPLPCLELLDIPSLVERLQASGGGGGDGITGMIFVVWIILMLAFLIGLGINFLLLKGANEKSPKKVKIYLIISLVMVVLGLIGSLTHTFSGAMALITLLMYTPVGYELWMVFCFFKEITSQPIGQPDEFEP